MSNPETNEPENPLPESHKSACALEAVKGYMRNRQTLCEALSQISSMYVYERDVILRKSIVDEIIRVDDRVRDILNSFSQPNE